MKIKTLGFVANTRKPAVFKIAADLLDHLSGKGLKVIVHEDLAKAAEGRDGSVSVGDVRESDVIVVFGGDGTLLHFARTLYPCDVPMLPVNLGNLGFLAFTHPTKVIESIGHVIDGNYKILKRMLLELKLKQSGKDIGPVYALNDVMVTRGLFKNFVNLKVFIGESYTTTYQADGVIISTPTGSTAVCLSAGGPIVHPELDALVMLPVCPHTLSNRPLVVPPDHQISVEITTSRKTDKKLVLSVDGQVEFEIDSGDSIHVARAEKCANMIVLPDEDYYDILRTKLRWGGKDEK